MVSRVELEACAICHDCDLLVAVGHIQEGHKACCPRCGYTISSVYKSSLDRILIFSLTAILCLLLSNFFGFVEMAVQGQQRQITLLETIRVLFAVQEWVLGVLVLLVIVILPLFFCMALCWLVIAIKLRLATQASIVLLSFVGFLRFWNMAEIFFLGILISMIKIASMANISLGFSFWAYALFNLSLILALVNFDKFQLARAIREIVNSTQLKAGHDLR